MPIKKKAMYMIVNDETPLDILINGHTYVKEVDELKYLGVSFDRKNRIHRSK